MEATALSVAKSALDGVLTIAKTAIADEVALQLGVGQEVAFIKDELAMMQSFLMAAEEEKGHSKVVRTWVGQVRDLAYDIEDSLEEFSLHLKKPSWWRVPFKLRTRHQIATEIKQLKCRVEDVSQRNLRYRLIKDPSSKAAGSEQFALRSMAALGINEAQRVRLQGKSKASLVDLITTSDEALRVISVWGRSDLGTTTVIREAYNKSEIGRTFRCRAWVAMMHAFHPNEFLRSLVRQFHVNSPEASERANDGINVGLDVLKRMETMGFDALAEEFERHVNEKRYLIVLDDVTNIAEWDWIKSYLPDMKNGSRIIVSTADGEVASQCAGQPSQSAELERSLLYDQSLYVFFYKESSSSGSDSTQVKVNADSRFGGPTTTVGPELSTFSSSLTIQEEPKSTMEVARESDSRHQLERDASSAYGSTAHSAQLARIITMSRVFEEAEFIGREESKAYLIRFISQDDGQLRVISVWGMGGLGKTTLVRNVYNNLELSQKFKCRAWVTVLHPFNATEFLRNLAIQLHANASDETENSVLGMIGGESQKKKFETMKYDGLKTWVDDYLKDKTYIIVLDDLLSVAERSAIEEILPVDSRKGSCVVVTTRRKDVAEGTALQNNEPYELKHLSHAASLDLFCQKVYKDTKYCKLSEDMAEQAENILKKCKGLPLAVATIGGFLATKPKTAMEWKQLLDHMGPELENNPNFEIIKVLSSSYDGLPYHLKSCFLYLSIFPNGHQIMPRRLVRRWMAEGYLRNMHGASLEEIEDNYFIELINRSMIQSSKDVNTTGGRRNRCHVHDMMLEVSMSKAKEENLVCILDENCLVISKDKVRHLVVRSGWNRDAGVLKGMNVSHIRSLTVFGEWQSSLISPNMRLLRVLDLEDASGLTNRDLRKIGKLRHLKYLGLRGTNISSLPKSLGKLKDLETLDIRETFIISVPPTVGKLRRLQYLRAAKYPQDEVTMVEQMTDNCPEPLRNRATALCILLAIGLGQCLFRDIFEPGDEVFFSVLVTIWMLGINDVCGVKVPGGIGKLKALHTLGVINIAQGRRVIKQLKKLTQLRRLGVTGITKKNGKQFCAALDKLQHLQWLTVRSEGKKGSPSCLEHVSSPPKHLQILKLYGNLGTLPSWIDKIPNLMKLYLRTTQLKQDAIQVLGKLPSLMFLRLYKKSFVETKLCFYTEMFPKLEMLHLSELDDLTSVTLQDKTMPKLELLMVSQCTSLTDDGLSGVQSLASLKKVKLWGMDDKETLVKTFQEQVAENPNKPNLEIV